MASTDQKDSSGVEPPSEYSRDPSSEKRLPPNSMLTPASAHAGGLEPAAFKQRPNEKGIEGPVIPRMRLIAISTGVALGLFLSILDSSVVATSLFSIAVDLGDVDRINWVPLAYTLTYLGCAVLFARIADVVGRRAAFLIAYVVFIAFSLACGFSQSMAQIIGFRAVQGLAGSGLYSVSMIILPELTPLNKRKYIAGIVGLVIAAAGVLGPVLGGILTQYASWRWVFWINGPVGAFSVVVFFLSWPEKKYLPSHERRAWKDVDFVGAFLLIAAVILIVFPFQNATSTASASTSTSIWSSAIFLAPLLAGLLCLTFLFIWQALAPTYFPPYKHNPNLALALPPALILHNRAYAFAALHTTLAGFPYLLCVYAFPVRFQVVYGKSALQAGLMLLPMLGGTAVGTVVAGAVNGGGGTGKWGKVVRFCETLAVAGGLMLLGCALETTAEAGEVGGVVEPKVLGFLVFVGLGFGLSAAGGTMLAGVEAPVHEHASAQGIMAQVRIFGGSIGIAASSAILGAKTRDALAGSGVPPGALAQMAAEPWSLPPEQWTLVRQVYTDALREDMIVCCAVLAVAVLCTLGIYRRNRMSMEDMMKLRYREEAERRRAAAVRQAEARVASETVHGK